MDWIDYLNHGPTEIALGSGHAEILYWMYQRNVQDNLPHRHTYYEVCLVGGHGSGIFTNLGRRYTLNPGDLFLARPGALHQIVNTGKPDMELYWICFQWVPDHGSQSESERILTRFIDSDIVYVPPPGQSQLQTLWNALQTLCEHDPPISHNQVELLAASVILAIAHAASEPDSSAGHASVDKRRNTSVERAMQYIHDNLDRPLITTEIAAHACVSPRQLSRIFQEFTGTSPAAYITRARLDRAGLLLRSTSRPIKDIAAAVGYPDIHHFTRVFAQTFGSPPASYRRGAHAHVPNIQNPGMLL